MYKILVIEDEAINQLILKQSLEQQGYEVAVASSGSDGLTLAETFQPALIVCDWMMPQMSGLEVCRQIKAKAEWSKIFFILLTARTAVKDRVEGLDSGADDFLSKPIQPSELLARVRAGLRIYQSGQDLRRVTQALQLQQQHLQTELSKAATYVTSLLPKQLSEPVSVSAQFLPSQQLGGDCFDFYWLDDDHLVLYVLDVSGHGLGAALPAVSMQQVLRSQSLPHADFYDPASVLTRLNQIFQMSEQNPQFFTLWYGIYQPSTQQLTHASAGHHSALIVNPAGKVRPLQQESQVPVGVLETVTYESTQCSIEPGSVLYAFSDGLFEIRHTTGDLWTYEKLMQLIAKLHQSGSVSISTLLTAISKLRKEDRFTDDCSVVQVKF